MPRILLWLEMSNKTRELYSYIRLEWRLKKEDVDREVCMSRDCWFQWISSLLEYLPDMKMWILVALKLKISGSVVILE